MPGHHLITEISFPADSKRRPAASPGGEPQDWLCSVDPADGVQFLVNGEVIPLEIAQVLEEVGHVNPLKEVAVVTHSLEQVVQLKDKLSTILLRHRPGGLVNGVAPPCPRPTASAPVHA